jgi:tetratricopeptide (TPR) repeat protein
MTKARGRRRGGGPAIANGAPRAAPVGHRWLLAAILLLTVAVYSRSLSNGFIYYDDPDVVVNNPYIRQIGPENVARWFTTPVQYMYMPLALLSHAIEYRLGGLDPFVYHLDNLLLHLACVVLVFWVLRVLTGNPRIALLVSLLFAVHPVNVDTVSWVAARTTLLATLFSLVALGCYGLSLERSRLRYLALSCLAFVLAACAKSSAVVLPVLLLLWDLHRGRRWDRSLLIEKIPFFAVALFFGVLGIVLRVDDVAPPVRYAPWDRVLVFLYALAHYLVRLVFPWPLSMSYAYPVKSGSWLPLPFFVAPLVLVAIVWGLRALAVPRKVVVFGLSFFVANVVLSQSVLLIDNFMANRYAYLAYLGPLFILASVFDRGWRAELPEGRSRIRRRAAWAAALVIAVAAFSGLAHARTLVWRDSLALFDDVIRKGQGSAWVYGTRGLVKLHTDDLAGARRDLDRALELDPSYTPGLCYRGVVNYRLREYPAALADLDRALADDPRLSGAYRDRGKVQLALGDEAAALADFDRAIELDPRSEAHLWRGALRSDRGDARGALADLDAWIAVAPDDGEAWYRRGLVELELSDQAAACEDVGRARRLGFEPPEGVTRPDCP